MRTSDDDVKDQASPELDPNSHERLEQMDFLRTLIRGYGSSERLGRWIWLVDLDAIRQGINDPPGLPYDQMIRLHVYWLSMMTGGLSEQSASQAGHVFEKFYTEVAKLCSDRMGQLSLEPLSALMADPIMGVYMEMVVRERNAAIEGLLLESERIALHARCPTFVTMLSAETARAGLESLEGLSAEGIIASDEIMAWLKNIADGSGDGSEVRS